MSAHHGAALILPANATPTGEAGSTRTVWSLGVVVELDGRPGWSTKLPLTVLPRGRAWFGLTGTMKH